MSHLPMSSLFAAYHSCRTRPRRLRVGKPSAEGIAGVAPPHGRLRTKGRTLAGQAITGC